MNRGMSTEALRHRFKVDWRRTTERSWAMLYPEQPWWWCFCSLHAVTHPRPDTSYLWGLLRDEDEHAWPPRDGQWAPGPTTA
jgi:hypothetical protein